MRNIAAKLLNLQSLFAIPNAHLGKTKRSAPLNVKSIRAQLISRSHPTTVQPVLAARDWVLLEEEEEDDDEICLSYLHRATGQDVAQEMERN